MWIWDLNHALTETLNVVACDDYTSPAGDLYTVDGVYDFVDTIPSTGCPGCDSLINVHLTLSQPYSSMTIYACNNYTSPGGNYFSTPGNYVFTDTLASLACPGVDSIVDIDLTITDNVYATVSVFSGVVFANQPGATYQWLDCDAGYAPIPGETDQDFLPAVDGNYACSVTIGQCSDTSACVFVESSNGAGLKDQPDTDIKVYPNPVSGQLVITNASTSFMSVRIFNTSGSELFFGQNQNTGKMEIDMSDFAKGMYYIKISTETGEYIRKVVKE